VKFRNGMECTSFPTKKDVVRKLKLGDDAGRLCCYEFTYRIRKVHLGSWVVYDVYECSFVGRTLSPWNGPGPY